MLQFFAENWGTLLVGGFLLAIVVLVLITMRKNKKKGKSSCGCGCGNCPSSGICHKE